MSKSKEAINKPPQSKAALAAQAAHETAAKRREQRIQQTKETTS